MKNPFKDFLYFSRGEGEVSLFHHWDSPHLFSGYIYSFRQNSRQLSEEESRIQAAALERIRQLYRFCAGTRKTRTAVSKKSERYEKRTVVLAPFDPNVRTPSPSAAMGLPAWMAKEHLTLSNKGESSVRPKISKVYGLTEEQYQNALPTSILRQKTL